MREIEFRGKRIDNNQWVYGCLTRYSEEMSIITVDIIKNEVYEVDTKTVGQYSGINDKNGKKVYEADVSRRDFHSSWYCDFKDGSFVSVPTIKVKRSNWKSTPINTEYLKDWEIIDNIHDNPELLDS